MFDPTQTDVNTVDGTTMARTVSFYDNEYGFTCNMVRTCCTSPDDLRVNPRGLGR